MMAEGYPKFRNDQAHPEIRIGAKEFECIGVTPPHDHPHVYLDMGEDEWTLCPYCATRYRFDSNLAGPAADPPECAYPDNPEAV